MKICHWEGPFKEKTRLFEVVCQKERMEIENEVLNLKEDQGRIQWLV